MNDRHPSGDSNPADSSQDFSYAPYGAPNDESPYDMYGQQSAQNGYASAYDGSPTGAYGGYAGTYGGGDPLFGAMHDPATDTGAYATGAYDTYGSYEAYGNYGYATGVQDASAWTDQSGYGYPPAQPGWDTGGFATGSFDGGGYDTGTYVGQDTTGQFQTGSFDTGAFQTGSFDTGAFDTSAYNTGQYDAGQYDAGGYDAGGYETGAYATGQFDTGAYAAGAYDTGMHDTSQWQTGQDWNAAAWETGQWDNGMQPPGTYAEQTSWDTDGYEHAGYETYEPAYAEHPSDEPAFAAFGTEEGIDATTAMPAVDIDGGNFMAPPVPADGLEAEFDALYAAHQDMDTDLHEAGPDDDAHGYSPAPAGVGAVAGVPHPRGRRRSPKPKRSALMTVAVPSVAVLGVTGVATASVLSGTEGDEGSAQAASSPDAKPVQPSQANKKLDSQLAGLSADADDFADRANRTQERLDLQKRQAEERKRKAAEAARKEAMRPKFALPVDQKGLSAQFGSAGVNWLSLHSGIDFPVDEGTPVKAATDGTISTKWDISFGNMAIITAPDGTETWYCHLSSTKIRSGEVKAGDVFGYSGTSGNSTGPHLHFEVHPGGADAIDPLAWLRGKGLNPL